jgi:hypothetical protein
MYDLIGDIHGHADELVQLLQALGYEKTHGAYRHRDRKVIFLGDFIDSAISSTADRRFARCLKSSVRWSRPVTP